MSVSIVKILMIEIRCRNELINCRKNLGRDFFFPLRSDFRLDIVLFGIAIHLAVSYCHWLSKQGVVSGDTET